MRVVGILYLALTHTVVVTRRARETKKQKSYSPLLYTVNHAGEDDRESQKSCCFLLRSVHAAITPLSPSTLLHLSDGDVYYCLSLPPFSSCVPFSAFGSDRLCAAGRRTLHTHAFKKATLPSFLLVIFSLSPMVTFLNLLHAL